MKSVLLFIALICAVTLGSSLTQSSATATGAKRERAVIKFSQPVMLMGTKLKAGEYLFVHDDLAMARGEACTFVYKGNADVPDKLVVSFHCTPAQRDKVSDFTVRSVQISPGLTELKEFQFGGSTEAHLMPVK